MWSSWARPVLPRASLASPVHSIHVSRHTVYWVQAQVGFGRVYFPGPNRVGARAHFMRWAQPILRLSRRACARANDGLASVNAGQPLMKNLSHFVKSVLYVVAFGPTQTLAIVSYYSQFISTCINQLENQLSSSKDKDYTYPMLNYPIRSASTTNYFIDWTLKALTIFKGFFQFEIIINVLVSSLWVIWIPMYNVAAIPLSNINVMMFCLYGF